MDGQIGIYRTASGGSGGSETIQQVLNNGNLVQAGGTLTLIFSDVPGNSATLSNAGMSVNLAGGTNDPNANYFGNELVLEDNQVNKLQLTRFLLKITTATTGEEFTSSNSLIQYKGPAGFTLGLKWPNMAANGVATLASRGGFISPNNYILNSQSGLTYTFVLTDANQGAMVEANNAATQTYTVPPHSSVGFLSGAVLTTVQVGAGKVTIAPGAGVTLISKGGNLSTNGQGVCISIVQSSTQDTWYVFGDLQA